MLPKEELFGADIIYISKESRIRHINAIRFIISRILLSKIWVQIWTSIYTDGFYNLL